VVRVLFSMDQATVGTYLGTPWVGWSHTFAADGNYTLQALSTSGFDCEAPSALGIDLPTPNPLKQGQTIFFPSPSKTYGDGNFDPGASASSGLPVTYQSQTPGVCTMVSGMVHVVAAGDCTIAVSQAGNADYAPKSTIKTFTIAKAPLSVDADSKGKQYGAADPTLTYGLHGFVNGETPGSANVSGGATCSVDPGAGPGVGSYPNAISCAPGTLSAANYSFQTGAGGTLTISQAEQTIDFPTVQGKTYGDGDFDPAATASSGLPVSYESQTPDVCTVVSGMVHILSAGDCSITASQTDEGNFDPAQNVTQAFTIAKAPLSIDADSQSKAYGDPDPALSYGLSGFVNGEDRGSANVNGDANCSIDPGAGPGAGSYPNAISCAPGTLSAPNYSFQTGSPGTLTISRNAVQTIHFPTVQGTTYGDNDFDPGASASSGLSVSYQSQTPTVCTIVSGKVHVVAVGDCTLTASQGGNGNYDPAADVTGTFTIGKAPLSIDADNKSKSYGAANPMPSSVLSGFVNGETRRTANVTGYASCSVDPAAGPDVGSYPNAISCDPGTLSAPNYSFQTGSRGTLTISKAGQTIRFTAPVGKTYGSADFSPASATSGLPISYQSQTPDVCTIVSGKVHIVSVGDCTVTASQAGNNNYEAADDVTRTFTIAPAPKPPVITIAKPVNRDTYYQYQTVFKADYSCRDLSGAGMASCAGDANLGNPIDTSTPGAHTFTVNAKDNAGNEATKTVNYNVIAVGSLDGGGAFVIGDGNAAISSRITFWEYSQWWKKNTLSGGPAASSFKGYADFTSGTPPRCGSPWTTRTGNSSKPPATVPPYMAVIVASQAQQVPGPAVRGDTTKVVVVKTGTGYAPNPGHPGTGTVVATLCG
jgi:hypothetical protein